MKLTAPALLIQCLLLTTSVLCGYWRGSGRGLSAKERCKAEEKLPWSYEGENGPQNWGKRYPTCNGLNQSPIALHSKQAIKVPYHGGVLLYHYDIPIFRANIVNDGRTVRITSSDGVRRILQVKNSDYELQDLHFHWGDNPSRGSEHTLDGLRYALELHLVHRNKAQGIAVLSVLYKETHHENYALQNIIKYLPKVMYNGTSAVMTTELHLEKLLPQYQDPLFQYQGSLTMPDCQEGVQWSVFRYPLHVGKKQMFEFRKLYSTVQSETSSKCSLSNNFRPIQKLNDRKVYLS